MDITSMKNIVKVLNEKAAKAGDANDALKFSQAALNSANSFCSLAVVTKADNN